MDRRQLQIKDMLLSGVHPTLAKNKQYILRPNSKARGRNTIVLVSDDGQVTEDGHFVSSFLLDDILNSLRSTGELSDRGV